MKNEFGRNTWGRKGVGFKLAYLQAEFYKLIWREVTQRQVDPARRWHKAGLLSDDGLESVLTLGKTGR